MKKILYIILDGLGDLPIKELDNRTPLDAADTPNMDLLAQKGKTGIVYTVGKNIAPESDIAVISLLGYDGHKLYTGRGPLESFAEGIAVHDGDLALRINFATVGDDGKTIIDRRVGRNLTTKEAGALSEEINSKVILSNATFDFKNTIGHRGILVIRGVRSRLSGMITNTDPAYGREGVFGVAKEKFENIVQECKPLEEAAKNPQAVEAARLLNEFTEKSHKVLQNSSVNKKRIKENKMPGNVILSRDAGDRLPKFPPMKKAYGVNFGSFVQMPVEKGIALLTGITVVDVGLPAKEVCGDYKLWAKLAVEKIKEFDGLYIHIKGPDEPAHDGRFQDKKKNIEDIDKCFFANLIPKLNLKDYIIAVTADHSTPCNLKAHSADPVPLLICGGNINPDGACNFSEKTAKNGSLGEVEGKNLLSSLIEFAKA